ncbi:MAG TPA: isoprenylcysteine carboxylmethyltransferase family protein [Candidatus Limnocylindrales bacterium]|nr:isoprenylcysteine carboxylmethyltransferase family protein [Candidatus Limnocylindrales bacterium]
MQSVNVAIGNFFFRYRNALFPLIFVLGSLLLRPQRMFDSVIADQLLAVAGLIIVLLGEAVRLITIGFQYIHRGGKNGKVYAGRLVRGGMYGITRNPMYVGNGLITIGMTMYFGSPLGYLVVIPFFLFVYQAIIAAEEAYLQNKFAAEYADYALNVNRIIPALGSVQEAFKGMRFDWRRSINKDMGTIAGLTIGLNLVPVWRAYFLYDAAVAKAASLRACWSILVITVVYLILRKLKRDHRLFQESADAQKS